MVALRSYVNGDWHVPSDEGVPLHDAVTGDEVARVSSAGIDMASVLEHGRSKGGPALAELTFHQRAALLKTLASHLR
ncbi:MAG: phenylacetic acid degradation bifunctional protein PaaZ, partial [Saccharopolyspora rectivirgula]